MVKKISALIIACLLICATSFVFATNEIKDSMDKAGHTMENVVNGAGQVVRDAGSSITDGARDVGNALSHSTDQMGSAMRQGTDNAQENYTTTRTSNDATILGMSANTWTWFVLAIAALAIVALVWYYAMQNKNEYHHND